MKMHRHCFKWGFNGDTDYAFRNPGPWYSYCKICKTEPQTFLADTPDEWEDVDNPICPDSDEDLPEHDL